MRRAERAIEAKQRRLAARPPGLRPIGAKRHGRGAIPIDAVAFADDDAARVGKQLCRLGQFHPVGLAVHGAFAPDALWLGPCKGGISDDTNTHREAADDQGGSSADHRRRVDIGGDGFARW